MPARLIIIGNSRLATDHSRMIDAADHVVRFNRMPHLGRHTGWRTTDLWLCNTGRPGREFASIELLRSLVHESGAHRLVLPAPRRLTGWNAWARLTARAHLTEHGREISRSARRIGIPCHHANASFTDTVATTLLDYGSAGPRFRAPSTGIRAIHHYCRHPDFIHHEILALGFSFTGWRGHAWNLESAYMQHLHDTGRLTWLDIGRHRGEDADSGHAIAPPAPADTSCEPGP